MENESNTRDVTVMVMVLMFLMWCLLRRTGEGAKVQRAAAASPLGDQIFFSASMWSCISPSHLAQKANCSKNSSSPGFIRTQLRAATNRSKILWQPSPEQEATGGRYARCRWPKRCIIYLLLWSIGFRNLQYCRYLLLKMSKYYAKYTHVYLTCHSRRRRKRFCE